MDKAVQIKEGREIRFRIFQLLVDEAQPMGLSEIARKLHVPQQKVAYHLPFLEHSGLIIRDGTTYFCQPVFLDDDLHDFVAEKIAEVIDQFSNNDNEIIVGEEMMDKDEVVLNCIYALVLLNLSPNGN